MDLVGTHSGHCAAPWRPQGEPTGLIPPEASAWSLSPDTSVPGSEVKPRLSQARSRCRPAGSDGNGATRRRSAPLEGVRRTAGLRQRGNSSSSALVPPQPRWAAETTSTATTAEQLARLADPAIGARGHDVASLQWPSRSRFTSTADSASHIVAIIRPAPRGCRGQLRHPSALLSPPTPPGSSPAAGIVAVASRALTVDHWASPPGGITHPAAFSTSSTMY
jgi:hypothetical protein